MKLAVYCRRWLVEPDLPADRPALLLEGAWPSNAVCNARRSLDQTLDGCERILSDDFADLPESAFYMIGAIDEVAAAKADADPQTAPTTEAAAS